MSWEAWGYPPDDPYDDYAEQLHEQGWLDEDEAWQLQKELSTWKITSIVSFIIWGTTLMSLGAYFYGR